MRKSMAVMVTALILMGLIAAALEPELFPRAISNKIETFYLGKLSDPSKVYLQKGIEKPGRVLELKMARIKEQKYHQDDLQVERREFLFHNGDLYWHDKITLKEGTGDLNYVINYEGNNGILTYYNESRDKWEEQELANGTLPFTDLFLTIDNKHIILTQPLIYQDLGPGVVKAIDHLKGKIKVTKTAQGFKLELPFLNKPGAWGEIWALESDSPLIDWNNETMKEIWPAYSYVKENRWLMDGAYYVTPSTYTPWEKNSYWRHPLGYVVSGFILTGGSRAADDLAYAQLYIQAQHMEKTGYIKTLPQSNWLYEEYGIKAGFFDTRFNTDLALLFIAAYQQFGEAKFLDYALQYGNFFSGFADKYHYSFFDSRGEEGWLVQDYYHEEENYRLPHSSLNHQLNEIRFLYQLGEISLDPSWIVLGNRLLKGIEITCDSWIKEDKNLHYAYYPDGSFGTVDYPYLTYNDLFHLQALLKNSTGSSSPYLQKLMDAKKEYMDLNGISAYKKTALGESFGYPSTWPKLEILYGDKQLSWIRGDSNFTGEPGGVIGNTMFGMNEEHLEQMPTNPVEAGAELCFMADEVPGLNQPVFQMQILNQNGTFSSYPINQNTILLPEKTGEYIFILSADWGNGDNNILYWFKVLLDETP